MTIGSFSKQFARVFAAFIFFASSIALAETTAMEATSTTSLENVKSSSWQVEGMLQAHSVSGAASPWFGIGGSFHLLNSLQLGLRGFVPLEHTVDNSTYAIQGFARERFLTLRHTEMFVEGEVGENFYNFIPFTSYGLSIGVLNHITPQISLGLQGGLEFANAVIDSVGLENRSDTVLYPKVAFMANFGF